MESISKFLSDVHVGVGLGGTGHPITEEAGLHMFGAQNTVQNIIILLRLYDILIMPTLPTPYLYILKHVHGQIRTIMRHFIEPGVSAPCRVLYGGFPAK